MNAKSLVRLSNLVGTVAIILLIYWVFIFIAIQVFGLKVFRENLTETFYLSVLGILALMIGALIMAVLRNGSQQMGWPTYFQEIIIGLVIIVAVFLDRLRQGRQV